MEMKWNRRSRNILLQEPNSELWYSVHGVVMVYLYCHVSCLVYIDCHVL